MTRRTGTMAAVGVAAVALAIVPWIGHWGGRGSIPALTIARAPFARRVLAEGNIEAAEATPVTAPLEAEGQLKIAWLVPDGTRVKAGDVVVRFDPTDMQRALKDGESNRSTAESKISGARAATEGEIRNLERDGEIARKELAAEEHYKVSDPEIFSRQEIIRSGIDRSLAGTRIQAADQTRAIKESLAKVDLDLLDIERRKAGIAIDRARKGLDAMEIRAPHDGLLVYRRDWRGEIAKVGDSVWPSQPVAEIPNLETLQARVYVLEADAGGLAPGLPAKVTIEAHPEALYDATVTKVDTLAKRRAGSIPVQYFGATLALASIDRAAMKPGERIQAVISLDVRSDAISIPRNAVFEKDGKKIVYRRRRFSFVPVDVVVGPAAVGRIVIEKGLAVGDVVALADPEASASTQDAVKPSAAATPTAIGDRR